MPHDRDARRQDAFDALAHLAPALKLDRMGATFLHDADGAVQGFFRVALVRSKGQVHHDQRALGCTNHGLGVVDHLVEGDGKGGFVTRHHIRRAVADEDDVDPCLVHYRGHGVVVCREHGDFLAALLHFMHHLGRDALGVFVH